MGVKKMNKIIRREGNTFTCFKCKKIYEYQHNDIWSEQDAIKEYENNYPESNGHEVNVLCNACHIEFKKWFSTLSEEQKKKMCDDYQR